MDAEIYAVDKGKLKSDGSTLSIRDAGIECTVGRFEGLPFGDARDQQYIEVSANSWEGDAKRTFTAKLNGEDVERILKAASGAGMI